jgi:hypothetical protein
MPYSLLQLLGRPGHFIHDYLSGKRQVSYPPFRMLFIVAVIALFIDNMLDSPEAVESGADAVRFSFMDKSFNWFEDNPGWGMIFLCGIFILPTWVVFRFAPRYPKHTLPEGFFIQVFMGTLVLLTSLLADLLAADVAFWLIIVYYFVVYLQLFGYRVWGTLWRMVVTFISGMGILVILIFSIEIIIKKGSTSPNHSLRAELFALALLSVLNCVLLYVSYKIGKRGWLRRSINGQQEEPMESEVEALTPGRSSKNSE